MKSESKRILPTIQRKAINPITDKPMFRTSDEVLEVTLEVFYQHLKGKKVCRAEGSAQNGFTCGLIQYEAKETAC